MSAGLINASELDEAIEYQCIYGGKLGTSLIELGLVEEDQMARILSRQLNLHYIKPELLMKISAAVLNLIPAKIALKYQVVPYYEDSNKLYVAVNDSNNLTMLDELAFHLNHLIVPLAIPEIRLMLALKKHYGMRLPPRYETLAAQLQRRHLAAQKQVPTQRKRKSPPSGGGEKMTVSQQPENTPWPLLGDIEYADDPVEDTYVSATFTTKDQAEADVLDLLAHAEERDDIAHALINHLRKDFPECGLLIIREETATGWVATGGKQDSPFSPFDQIVIDLNRESLFRDVVTNRNHYLGPVFKSTENRKILSYFCSRPSQQALAVPLTVQNRLVSILYVQGALEILEQHLTELQSLAGKAEMAFKLLIIKNKILNT